MLYVDYEKMWEVIRKQEQEMFELINQREEIFNITQPKATTTTQPKPATQSTANTPSTSATFNAKDYTLVETYTVKSGDNPYNIAKRYSWATADEILKWNNISDPSKLQIGQKLKIYKKK